MIRVYEMFHHHFKLLVVDSLLTLFNVSAWFATLVSWANVNQVSNVLSAMAATSVSIATFFWIRAQSRAFARVEAEQIERHARQEANWREIRRQGDILDRHAESIEKISSIEEKTNVIVEAIPGLEMKTDAIMKEVSPGLSHDI